MNAPEHLLKFDSKQLKEEYRHGLKLYAETAWGWSELNPVSFIKQIQKNKSTVLAYVSFKKSGAAVLKIPFRTS